VHGKKFVCKTRVRQGDPISLILYVFCSDSLQYVVNDLLRQGKISLPIEINDPDFPLILYVDDELLILLDDIVQVMALKDLLHKFSLFT
jgi:hypothetical protein